MALILPQMDQDALYRKSEDACRLDTNPLHNPPHIGLATILPTFICPADSRLSTPHRDDVLHVDAAFTSYIGIGGTVPDPNKRGLFGVLGPSPGCRLTDITDGTSQTLMLGERPPPDSWQAGIWYPLYWQYPDFRGPNNTLIFGAGSPYLAGTGCSTSSPFGPGKLNNPCDRLHLWSLHPGGANFIFADASGRFLPYSAVSLMMAMGSRDGGEVISSNDN